MKSYTRKNIFVYFSFLTLSIIFLVPIIYNHSILFSGDDYSFHLSRTYSLYDSFVHHHFLPTFDYNSFNSRATIFNIFYPYVMTTLPIVIFRFIIGNWLYSFYLFFMLSSFLTSFISYRLFNKLANNVVASYLFSILYTFSQYRIINAYVRFDLGEYMALTFVPLVLLELEIIIQKKDYSKWFLIPIGMAGIIYSHLLTGLTISIVILVRLLFSWYQVNWKTILAIIKSIILTILLTLYQTIPIIEQFTYLKLNSVVRPNLEDHLQDISDLFKFDPLKSTTGIVVVFLGFLAISNIRHLHFHEVSGKQTIFLGFAFLISTTSIFPWFLLNKTSMTIIQFPYRLTIYATFYLLFSGVIYLVSSLKIPTSFHINMNYLLLTTSVTLCVFATSTQAFSTRAISLQNEIGNSVNVKHAHFELFPFKDSLTADYRPTNSTKRMESIENKKFSVNGKSYDNSIKLLASSNSFHFKYISNKTNTIIDTPIVDYRGVKVADNTNTIATSRTDRSTVKVSLKKRGVHNLTITFKNSLLRITSLFISVTTLCLLIIWRFLSIHNGHTSQQLLE